MFLPQFDGMVTTTTMPAVIGSAIVLALLTIASAILFAPALCKGVVIVDSLDGGSGGQGAR